jgi:hypothetical protein
MNERIQELADEAGIPAIDGKWDYNDRNLLVKEDGEWRVAQLSEIISTMIQSERGLNKFAQLIVEECANVADENYIHRGSRTCGLAIRLHFGVE